MNPAPLPQPAPFTCPHCGVGLKTLEGFCPCCGTPLDKLRAPRLSLWTIVSLVFGLVIFGGMGVCGAILTVHGFLDKEEDYILLIGNIPSLGMGAIGFVLCLHSLVRRR